MKFQCFDCKRDVDTEPISVLRKSDTSPGVKRVNICTRCRKGKNKK